MSERALGRTTLVLLSFAALATAGVAQAQSARIVALGDSNTAGFGVGSQAAFPARLEALLRSAGLDVQVLNAGISGDTTAGMLARLDGAVPPGTGLVIVQGGYNDLRRGGTRESIAANVEAILVRLRARGIRAVLCGFYNEPWGVLARRNGAVLVDANTCYDANNRGFDGLHMNAAGHQVVAARLFPVVQPLLAGPRRRRG